MLTLELLFYYNKSMSADISLPVSLTPATITFLNKFYQDLDEDDKKVFRDLLSSASQNWWAVNVEGKYLPEHAFLLALMIEEHRQVARLAESLEMHLGSSKFPLFKKP